MSKPKKPTSHRTCDFCGTTDGITKNYIPTNWFRGDDVLLNLCKEHRKESYFPELLRLPKSIKQMEE